MLFNSFIFIVFLFLSLIVHSKLKTVTAQNIFIIIISSMFYAAWNWHFLLLIYGVIIVAYSAGRAIEAANSNHQRTAFATVGITISLCVLAYFKYANFFIDSLVHLASTLGWTFSNASIKVLLPVGISFYTFQAISYIIDVKRRTIKCERSLINVSVYIIFFPQLVAGPIVRAAQFIPQTKRHHKIRPANLLFGAKLFAIGLLYKAGLSDHISHLIDPVFTDLSSYTATSIRVATIGFYCQIYFDFAGYSIMAIGVSRMFGYRLPRNFNFPYLATSIADFWRRWHISLSSWLRDYLYISLGGNRISNTITYRNLIMTMLLGGLWHGASIMFLIWGAIHGVCLAIHRYLKPFFVKIAKAKWGTTILLLTGFIITQSLVLIAWGFFRPDNYHDSLLITKSLVGISLNSGTKAIPTETLLFLIPLYIDHLWGYRYSPIRQWCREKIRYLFSLNTKIDRTSIEVFILGAIFSIILMMFSLKTVPFIYFQF